VENEGNEPPVSDPRRMVISVFNKLNEELKEVSKEDHRKDLKEELKENIQVQQTLK
jgi:predicted DNA-binding protein YlxM (UPF0122 family)